MSKKLTREDLTKLAESSNHSIISFDNYKNVHSFITVGCNTCNSTFETSVDSYKNAKQTGCLECKKAATSKTHKNKVVSNQTGHKIGLKASQRIGSLTIRFGNQHPRFKNGSGRDLKNPSKLDYDWKNSVRKRCQQMCVITKEKWKVGERFVCHHLNSYDVNIDQRYLPENGVFLKREIHKKFHDTYDYGNNTEQQFAEFCRFFYNIDWFSRKEELFNSK